MTDEELQREIIHELIFNGARTASRIADRFGLNREKVITSLRSLKSEGNVTTVWNEADGDCFCTHCQLEWAGEEPGNTCPSLHCGGYLKDDCRWIFCGGPISQALKVA